MDARFKDLLKKGGYHPDLFQFVYTQNIGFQRKYDMARRFHDEGLKPYDGFTEADLSLQSLEFGVKYYAPKLKSFFEACSEHNIDVTTFSILATPISAKLYEYCHTVMNEKYFQENLLPLLKDIEPAKYELKVMIDNSSHPIHAMLSKLDIPLGTGTDNTIKKEYTSIIQDMLVHGYSERKNIHSLKSVKFTSAYMLLNHIYTEFRRIELIEEYNRRHMYWPHHNISFVDFLSFAEEHLPDKPFTKYIYKTLINATDNIPAMVAPKKFGGNKINAAASAAVPPTPTEQPPTPTPTEQLLKACETGDAAKVTELLASRGVDINCKDQYANTPLHHACSNGHAHVALLLLDIGADTSVQSWNGSSPLHYACQNDHTEVAILLASRGADVNAKNFLGDTVLMRCSNYAMRATVQHAFASSPASIVAASSAAPPPPPPPPAAAAAAATTSITTSTANPVHHSNTHQLSKAMDIGANIAADVHVQHESSLKSKATPAHTVPSYPATRFLKSALGIEGLSIDGLSNSAKTETNQDDEKIDEDIYMKLNFKLETDFNTLLASSEGMSTLYKHLGYHNEEFCLCLGLGIGMMTSLEPHKLSKICDKHGLSEGFVVQEHGMHKLQWSCSACHPENTVSQSDKKEKTESEVNKMKWGCSCYSATLVTWACLTVVLLIMALSNNNWSYTRTDEIGYVPAYENIYGLNSMSIMSDSVDDGRTYDIEKTFTINGITASCTGTYDSLLITFKCGSEYSYSFDECGCSTFRRNKSIGTVVKILLSIASSLLFIFCFYQFTGFNIAFRYVCPKMIWWWCKYLFAVKYYLFAVILLILTITSIAKGDTLTPTGITCFSNSSDCNYDRSCIKPLTWCYRGPALNLSISAIVLTCVGLGLGLGFNPNPNITGRIALRTNARHLSWQDHTWTWEKDQDRRREEEMRVAFTPTLTYSYNGGVDSGFVYNPNKWY